MANSFAHTKWVCKYHIVFPPKYRRKIIYNQLRKDIQEIIKKTPGQYTLACTGPYTSYSRYKVKGL